MRVSEETKPSRFEETALPFYTRERRGAAFVPEEGPPANRSEKKRQPFHQRVRRDDLKRLGIVDV